MGSASETGGGGGLGGISSHELISLIQTSGLNQPSSKPFRSFPFTIHWLFTSSVRYFATLSSTDSLNSNQ